MGNKQNWAANTFRLKKAQGKTEDMADETFAPHSLGYDCPLHGGRVG